MKSWIRITSVAFVLIGGTTFFGYWALAQFDHIFDSLSDFNVANILTVSRFVKINDGQTGTTSSELIASSSPFSYGKLNDEQIATSSLEGSLVSATSTDLSLFFTFPRKGDELYIGCTYQISWQSSTTVDSLGIALIDAGTREIAGPIASGLARENKIENNSQKLDWKVGVVWPGEYYIKVSRINNINIENKSKIFLISKIPEGVDDNERADICGKFSE